MKTNRKNILAFPARYENYAPVVAPTAPFRGAVENELEQLKNRLLRRELQLAEDVEQNVFLRRAANEAAALAWLTPYPLLLLPTLLEEKARCAKRKAARQQRIRSQTTGLLTLAE